MKPVMTTLAVCLLTCAAARADCPAGERCPDDDAHVTACSAALDAVSAWTVEDDAAEVASLIGAVGDECGADAEQTAAREAARTILAHVMPLWSLETDQPELDALLDDAARLNAGYWQVHALRGDRAEQDEDWALAAAELQRAVDLANDPALTSPNSAAPPELIESFIDRAEIAMRAAEDFVPIPRGRDGAQSGVMTLGFRGGVRRRVIPPIEFSTCAEAYVDDCGLAFTETGTRYAAALWELVETGGPRIGASDAAAPTACLVGHTDENGPADANRALSARRAEAVRAFLVAQAEDAQTRIRETPTDDEAGWSADVEAASTAADAALTRVRGLQAAGCGEDHPISFEGTFYENLDVEIQRRIQRRVVLDLTGECSCETAPAPQRRP